MRTDKRVLHIGNTVSKIHAHFKLEMRLEDVTQLTTYILSLITEANKMKEKLTKLEKQSRVRDAMVKISSEISGLNLKQEEAPPECVSVSFDTEEIDAIESHDKFGNKKVPNQVSP